MGLFFGSSRRRRSRSVFSYIPLIRWVGPIFTILVVLAGCFFVLTGRIDLSVFDTLADSQTESTELVSASTEPNSDTMVPRPRPHDSIRIATFNIQMFGDRKSSTRTIPEIPGVDVMGTIASIFRQFDLVAIQEVRSPEQIVITRLIDLINEDGSRYTARVSPLIGTPSDLQAYAFVWDSTRVQMTSEPYMVQDPADRMHREPLVGSFQAILDPAIHEVRNRQPFRFTLINVQNDPRPANPLSVGNPLTSELRVLDDVFVRVRDYEFARSGEDDCILVGDLNAGPNELEELGLIPNVESIAGDIKTDVLRQRTLDHILIDRTMTTEFTSRVGVIDFQRDFRMSETQAKLISDHLPLWAEFSVYESERFESVARRPAPP